MRPYRAVPALLLTLSLATVAGCGGSAPPTVSVGVAGRTETLSPTQLCLDDEAEFFDSVTRPVLRVEPEQAIRIEVSADLAASGWQVQIFDRDLATRLGQVDAGNVRVLDDLTTSDPFPAAYFLVVVQDAGEGCDGLSGAWPVGFVRDGDPTATGSGGPPGTTAPSPTATPSGLPAPTS